MKSKPVLCGILLLFFFFISFVSRSYARCELTYLNPSSKTFNQLSTACFMLELRLESNILKDHDLYITIDITDDDLSPMANSRIKENNQLFINLFTGAHHPITEEELIGILFHEFGHLILTHLIKLNLNNFYRMEAYVEQKGLFFLEYALSELYADTVALFALHSEKALWDSKGSTTRDFSALKKISWRTDLYDRYEYFSPSQSSIYTIFKINNSLETLGHISAIFLEELAHFQNSVTLHTQVHTKKYCLNVNEQFSNKILSLKNKLSP